MRGIHTIEDIRQRCSINEAGCWVWRMATASASGRPAAYIPALGRVGTIGQALMVLGGKSGKRSYYPAKCRNKLCCNPEHQSLMTRSQVTLLTAKPKSPLTIARIARTKAKNAPLKLTADQYLEIRGSKKLLREIQAEYGISRCYASQLRSGEAGVFRQLDQAPTLARGASVFSWGGA